MKTENQLYLHTFSDKDLVLVFYFEKKERNKERESTGYYGNIINMNYIKFDKNNDNGNQCKIVEKEKVLSQPCV